MPAVEAALDRFRAHDTQVLGISIDSIYCHANWGRDLGGVSFPLLSDFQPKGAVAASFDHYLDKPGITDRATVVVDKEGIVRYSHSVTPAGVRSEDELLASCAEVHGRGPAACAWQPAGVADDSVLFVKSACGASLRTQIALDNLGLTGRLTVRNVSEDKQAKADLLAAGGKDQAPCLVSGGEAVYEAEAICQTLADKTAPVLG